MKNIITVPGPPETDKEPLPDENPAPELPKREHKHIINACMRTGFMAVALVASTWLCAQTPTPAPSSTPSATKQPLQPAAQPNQGWTRFNEDVGTRLELKGDQLQQLQEVDNRYNDRYTGMGSTPWTNPGYKALSEQRSTDVQKILTPEQYQQWTSTYGGTAPSQKTQPKPTNTGTTTPPTGSH